MTVCIDLYTPVAIVGCPVDLNDRNAKLSVTPTSKGQGVIFTYVVF